MSRTGISPHRDGMSELYTPSFQPDGNTRIRDWTTTLIIWPALLSRLRRLNPLTSGYFKLYRQLDDTKSRCILGLGLICSVAAGVPLPLIAVVFRGVVDSFPPAEEDLQKAIHQIIGIALAYFVITWTWAVCWGAIGGRISRRLQESLVRRVMGMDLAWFDVEAPDLASTLTADTQTVQRGTSEKVGLFIQSLSYFVATFITGFILSPPLTGVLFAAIVPSMLLLVWTGSTVISSLSTTASELTERAALVAEGAIKAVTVVQAFGAHEVLSQEHTRILRNATSRAVRKSAAGACMLGLVIFICYSVNALAFFWGVRVGGSSGTIYAVVFLILDASFVVNQVGPFIQNIAVAAGAGNKIQAIIEQTSGSIDVYADTGHKLEDADFRSEITLKDVTFAYPARPTSRVLESVSLTFAPGTSTGIVGLSGSGKSTLASLLLRLYDPSFGSVFIGDKDLKDVNVVSLRRGLALVDQSPVLFSGSILENIRHGILDSQGMSEAEISERCLQAAKDANANFIFGLSHGIHTQISGSGGLSGGQRQRVCLARALIRQPAILVLDEPTSALDATSEAEILQALTRVAQSGCTVIMIAHRLATIQASTNIVVMGEGTVLEQGNHEYLMQQDGAYAGLVRAQQLDASDMEDVSPSEPDPDTSSTLLSEDEKSMHRPRQSQEVQANPQQGTAPSMSTKSLIMRCWILSRPERPLLILGTFASIIAGALIVGDAIIFGRLISILNTVSDEASLRSQVDFYALMFFVISVVALLAYSTSGTCFGLSSEAFLLRVRDQTLRTTLRQDQAWFQHPEHASTRLMASMNSDASHLSGLTGVIISTAFSVSSNIVSGVAVSLVFAWKLSLVLLSTTPAIVAAGYLRVKMLTAFDRQHSADFRVAAALASEAVSNIRTVAAFGREHAVLNQYKKAIDGPYVRSFKFNLWGNLALSFSYSVIFLIYPLAYWWGARLVREGQLSQQAFFTALPAFLLTAQQSGQFFSMAPELTAARSAANKIFTLLDEKPTIMGEVNTPPKWSFLERKDLSRKKSLEPSALQEKQPFKAPEQSHESGSKIVLESVSLAYPNRPDHYILHDLDFTINRSEFIGIVGPSGAGKSSIISLLERFYDPTMGHVLVDDKDVRSSDVSEYRARISLVAQEPDLFAGSISFNISLGARPNHTATQDDIEEVCKRCGVHDFVMSLAEGYNTECGPSGSQLSGGQKQRIAVARALIRDPQILLLDEATSALDSHSEKEVQQAVAAASSGRTTIVVAHRLSSVQNADRILCFDQGRLIEQGTHSELVTLNGIYSGMVRAQVL